MPVSRAKKNVALLALCQAIANTAQTTVITVSALAGALLAEDKSLATLPHSMMWLGTMATSMPASQLMRLIGRRNVFLLGALLGAAGVAVGAYGLFRGSFWTFCTATFLLGGFQSVSMFYRFAAAEAAEPAFRAKAISLVIGGGVVAAVIGPELSVWSKDWFAPAEFAGTYVALIALPVLLAATLAFIEFPAASAPQRGSTGRPLAEIARQPAFRVALLGGMVSWGAMVLVMTATPLSVVGCGHTFADSAFVIQWHVLGMYAPSFVTGWLIARLGTRNVIFAGLALFTASVAVALSGVTVMHFWLMNLLIGVGWNLMFVGATDLLTRCYTPAERGKVEGFNDLLVFGTVASATFVSGFIHHLWGWDAVNLVLLPMIAALALAVATLRPARAPVAAE
jgi:MFS family permease